MARDEVKFGKSRSNRRVENSGLALEFRAAEEVVRYGSCTELKRD